MVLPGAVSEEPFSFTYSGNYTDNRDADGKGTVRLNTSGTLTVLSGTATVSVYILGAGGGAAKNNKGRASGGSGGYQAIEVELVPGTYLIIIGTGGAAANGTSAAVTAGNGGDTIAFNITSTGGIGGYLASAGGYNAGDGGTPNGAEGSGSNGSNMVDNVAGGSPNGGSVVNGVANSGGDGYVELTFI